VLAVSIMVGTAQDSGVETECDGESNDSSVSSPDQMNLPSAAAEPLQGSSSSHQRLQTANTSSSPLTAMPSTSSAPMQTYQQFPRPPVRDESLGMSGNMSSGQQLTSEDSSNQSGTGGESNLSNMIIHTDSNPAPAEDGYLGDCSSDGGNEKNFPLPADWYSRKQNCACHTSRHSLPPSPASSHQAHFDTSPPPPTTSSSPPNRMEDMEPPAGLQFSNIAQSPDNGGTGYGYQLLNSRERSQRSLKTKMRSTGLRSRYNSGVEQDWARIKSAISDRKLRMAASHNNTELVEKLCSNGANVRCFDEHKRTPLHFASAMGYTEVADILLKHGADPNQKDKLGNTALHLAACTSHVPVVTLLLRAGTDLTTIDNNGRTPMQLAQAKLKILQRSSSTHTEMVQVKCEVSAVLDMMREYLKKVLESRDTARSGKSEAFSQLIESFSQRLNLHTSHTDLSTDLGNLLQSMGTLSLQQQTE